MPGWFGPKRYGWGLTPTSWQGWALTVVYVVVVIVLSATLAATQTWVFLTLFALATAAFLLIAFFTKT